MADELHYIEYDPESVWDEMMKTYVEAGGDILYPGDEKEILLRGALAIAQAIMAKVDSALRMATLTYATGEYLKEYGLKRNCVYIDAVPATVPVAIEFSSGGAAGTVPAGTEMTADGVMLYALTEDLNYTGAEQTFQTTLRCVTPGAAGNGLPENTEMQFITGVDGFYHAVTTAAASGGVDAEDEEVYRERIRSFGLSSVTTGPAQAYEAAAKAVSSQIIDARALNEDTDVGIYLLLREGADSAEIIAAVEAALSPQTTRPLTDHVTVSLSSAETYSLNAQIWYDEYTGASEAIEKAIASYQEWQDNHIGRAFNPDKLTAMLYQAGCTRVALTGGMEGAESPEYTEIDPDAHCAGTITTTPGT